MDMCLVYTIIAQSQGDLVAWKGFQEQDLRKLSLGHCIRSSLHAGQHVAH